MTELLIAWIALAVGVGWWANEWGRNPVAWGTIAFLLSPLVAGIGLVIKGRDWDVLETRRL